MKDQQNCGTCRFWKQCDGLSLDIGDGDPPTPYGWCHRYPPSPYNDEGNPREKLGSLPATSDDEWCGEWKSAEPDLPSFDDVFRRCSVRLSNIMGENNINSWEELLVVENPLHFRNLGRTIFKELQDVMNSARVPIPERWIRMS